MTGAAVHHGAGSSENVKMLPLMAHCSVESFCHEGRLLKSTSGRPLIAHNLVNTMIEWAEKGTQMTTHWFYLFETLYIVVA